MLAQPIHKMNLSKWMARVEEVEEEVKASQTASGHTHSDHCSGEPVLYWVPQLSHMEMLSLSISSHIPKAHQKCTRPCSPWAVHIKVRIFLKSASKHFALTC